MSNQVVASQQDALRDFAQVMAPEKLRASSRIDLRPDDAKNSLGKLVLTVLELIRQLLERQAIRRIEAGTLTEAEIERLGKTFMQLSEQMEQMKEHFGLDAHDLNIDLGPLGRLL